MTGRMDTRMNRDDLLALFYSVPKFVNFGICDAYIHAMLDLVEGREIEPMIPDEKIERHLVGKYWG